jgi:aconitase B
MASQDTTGTITRLALRLLTCEKFVPPVLQTLCHTSAHPKPNDLLNFESLPKFFKDREGIGLHRGDGVIHSWLKKMSALGWLIVIGDSHGRNVFGAAVPGDSLLVATAGAFGKIPYTIPKSIRVEFKGDWTKLKPRDIQLALIEKLLSLDLVDQYDEKNILNGLFIEIYGLDEMPSELKFEIMNSMGEYGPASQWIYTPTEVAVKEVKEFIQFWEGYKGTGRGDVGIQKLIDRLQAWLDNPYNPVEDEGAEYHYELVMDLDNQEPLVTLPGVTREGKPGNSYLNVRRLSEVPKRVSTEAHLEVEEGMVLSCVSRTEHFIDSMSTVIGYIEKSKSVGGDRMWYSAPTVDIEKEIRAMGLVDKLRKSVESIGLVFWDFMNDSYESRVAANFRWEMPGCSLCMGNQEIIDVAGAKLVNGVESVRDIRVVWGSNTRNNDGRVGPKGETFSFICDPFLATCAFLLRKPPTVEEYNELETLRDASKQQLLA